MQTHAAFYASFKDPRFLLDLFLIPRKCVLVSKLLEKPTFCAPHILSQNKDCVGLYEKNRHIAAWFLVSQCENTHFMSFCKYGKNKLLTF